MESHALLRVSRALLLTAACAVFLTGCSIVGGGRYINKEPEGFRNTAGTRQWNFLTLSGDADAVRRVPLVAERQHRINGATVEPGTRLYGLFKPAKGKFGRESWLLKPRYLDIRMWHPDFAYVLEPGSKTYDLVHFTSLGQRRTATDIETVEMARVSVSHFGTTGFHVGTRPSRQYPGDLEVVFFGPDGHESGRIDRVADIPFTQDTQPVAVTRTGEAYIARHRDTEVEGQYLDVVYSPEGLPLSPPMPPFHHVKAYYNGVRELIIPMVCIEVADIHETNGYAWMHWPLMDNGTIVPMPEGCMGARAITYRDHDNKPRREIAARGWAVLWRTEDGPLWALLPPDATLEDFVTSRDHAVWVDYAMTVDRNGGIYTNDLYTKPITIARRNGAPDYIMWNGWPHETDKRPVAATFPWPSRALRHVAEAEAGRLAAEREIARQRYEAWERQQAAAREHEAQRARERARLAEEHRFEASLALQRKDFRAALDAAHKANDGPLVRRIVFQARREGRDSVLTVADLSRAAAGAHAEDRKNLEREIARLRRNTAQFAPAPSTPRQIDWGAAFGSTSSGSSRASSNPSHSDSYNRSMQRVEEYRWNARMNYLQGKSSSLPYGW